MSKNNKIKIAIFTSIILISSIILVFLAANAYSYPDARADGKVSITQDDTNKKIIINNPNNLSLSYYIEENTNNLSDETIEQLKADTTSIEQLNSEISTLNSEITALNNEITPLEDQLNAMMNEKAGLESQKAEWESQKASYESEANSLRSEIEYWGTTVYNLESRVAQMQANASASTEAELYAATHELEQAQEKLGNLRSDLADAEDNINMLTQNISNADDEISYYTDQIRTKNSQIAGKTATLTTKQNQVSQKETQISTIQRQMPSLPSQPTSGYTNLSSNEISYDALEEYSNKNVLLWIKSTQGSNTYYDYFLVTIPDLTETDIAEPYIPAPPTYTVTFDPVDGIVQTKTKEVKQGEKYGELPTPTKENSTFTGWFTEKENGTQIKSDTIVNLSENQILYAHYEVTKNDTDQSNDNKNDTEDVKYGIKDVTGDEFNNTKKQFSDAEDIYVFDSTIDSKDKGKDITYRIDLPKGYNVNDNIIVYAYVNGEKIVVPHTIENGKIVFKTTLTGRFVIAKYKSTTNTSNNETIVNPQTGDINVRLIVILLVIAIIISGISLVNIIKNNKEDK